MHKSLKAKAITSVGSATLILSGAAMAGPPSNFEFDNYTVNNGAINLETYASSGSTCPSTYTCGTATTGNGFLQRKATDGSGNEFFQTIISNEGATQTDPSNLGFADESFVQAGTNGVSGQQRVNGDSGVFSTTSSINKGWANTSPGTSAPSIDISQSLTDTGGDLNFTDSFNIQLIVNENGTPNDPSDDTIGGRFMDLDQNVELNKNGAGTVTDEQTYAMRQRSGSWVTGDTASPFTLDSGNETLDWSNGDDVNVIWIGQAMPNQAQNFGFQSYGNKGPLGGSDTDGVGDGPASDYNGDGSTDSTMEAISYFDTSVVGSDLNGDSNKNNPFTWDDPPFGSTPTL